ncbi:hypothetical protein EG328_002351 [Venturia inaequalis]|uniref:Aminoglycoside phosphotransferase domain-containing protein n=1 Tax=Venturia inaequalis TaxID=5025 RepID=A0A8H3V7U6_VENIN|nr:hypothetical protein EG328_002351 [Venturia inaequalis]KAE9981979.1 hypothetical protein EG327_006043 [Venturia inaequalis]
MATDRDLMPPTSQAPTPKTRTISTMLSANKDTARQPESSASTSMTSIHPKQNQPRKPRPDLGLKGKFIDAIKRICPTGRMFSSGNPRLIITPPDATVIVSNSLPTTPRDLGVPSGPTPSASPQYDDEDDPLWWGPTATIDQGLICRLAKRLVGDQFGDRCWIKEQHAGSYNRVYIIMFDNGTKGDGSDCSKVALKVPAAGWAPRWSPGDAVYLRSEALTLRYIHQQGGDDFSFVPKMIAYDTTFENEINAPYILMTHLEGRPAHKVWGFSEDEDIESRKRSPHDDHIRSNLLSSLASAMVKLKRIEFKAIGLPDYLDDECSGPHIRSEFAYSTLIVEGDRFEEENFVPHQRREWTEIPKFSSTSRFFEYWIKKAMGGPSDKGRFLELLHKEIPASRRVFADSSQPETFSLSHNDLNLQNILCDDLGCVTGIVDWEGCTARPHHLGWAALPLWLRADWERDYNWPFNKFSLSPFMIQDYRDEYIMHLTAEAPEPNKREGSYPAMSYLTCSLYEACRFPNGDLDLWCHQFLDIALPGLGIRDFFQHLNHKGWVALPQELEMGVQFDKWLTDEILTWFFHYGRPSQELFLSGFFDPEVSNRDTSSTTSAVDDGNRTVSTVENDHDSEGQALHVVSPGTPDTVFTASPSSSPRSQKEIGAPGGSFAAIKTETLEECIKPCPAILGAGIAEFQRTPSQNLVTQEEVACIEFLTPPPSPPQSLDEDVLREDFNSSRPANTETILEPEGPFDATPKTAQEEAIVLSASRPPLSPSSSQLLETGILTEMTEISPSANISKSGSIARVITEVSRIASTDPEANYIVPEPKAIIPIPAETLKSTISTQVLEPAAPEPYPVNIAETVRTTCSINAAVSEPCASATTGGAEEKIPGGKIKTFKAKFWNFKVKFGQKLRTMSRHG